MTIDTADGNWEIQTLEPLSEIRALHEKAGGAIALSSVIDLKEMGVPEGLVGTVESISGCPRIQKGPGRVVLTTVNHLNDFLYKLTLSDINNNTDTLGVTGYHRFYTQDRGWVIASELYLGEEIRGAHGDVKVMNLVRTPGTQRVYNMTVETDHVYYVGDLTALVHNNCPGGPEGGSGGADDLGPSYGDEVQSMEQWNKARATLQKALQSGDEGFAQIARQQLDYVEQIINRDFPGLIDPPDYLP